MPIVDRPEKKTGKDRQSALAGKAACCQVNVTVSSFGYKEGDPPVANLVFDVRFLKNPFWVPELRELTGLDQLVADYVLRQPAAIDFLDSLLDMLTRILPLFAEIEPPEFTIALGCTGGQHRSVALVEELASRLKGIFSTYRIVKVHRELDGRIK